MCGCKAVYNGLIDYCRDVKLTVDAVVVVIDVATICALCIFTVRMVVSCVGMEVDGDGVIMLRGMRDTHRVAVYFKDADEQKHRSKKQQARLSRR